MHSKTLYWPKGGKNDLSNSNFATSICSQANGPRDLHAHLSPQPTDICFCSASTKTQLDLSTTILAQN